MGHSSGKQALIEAWSRSGLGPMTQSQLYAAMAVACLETWYGEGWTKACGGTGAMIGSNNWGAIQTSLPPCEDGYSRLCIDTHPNDDGSSTKYESCFREYPTPADGALGLLGTLYGKRPKVLEAAKRGNMQAVAQAMHDSKYYEGFGKTVQERIDNYAKALWRCYQGALKETGDPPCFELDKDFGAVEIVPGLPTILTNPDSLVPKTALFVAGAVLGAAALYAAVEILRR